MGPALGNALVRQKNIVINLLLNAANLSSNLRRNNLSRSLKGPFVANHLLKVQKLNDQDDKKLSKLGHDHLQLSQL
jgi:hypothetical protein